MSSELKTRIASLRGRIRLRALSLVLLGLGILVTPSAALGLSPPSALPTVASIRAMTSSALSHAGVPAAAALQVTRRETAAVVPAVAHVPVPQPAMPAMPAVARVPVPGPAAPSIRTPTSVRLSVTPDRSPVPHLISTVRARAQSAPRVNAGPAGAATLSSRTVTPVRGLHSGRPPSVARLHGRSRRPATRSKSFAGMANALRSLSAPELDMMTTIVSLTALTNQLGALRDGATLAAPVAPQLDALVGRAASLAAESLAASAATWRSPSSIAVVPQLSGPEPVPIAANVPAMKVPGARAAARLDQASHDRTLRGLAPTPVEAPPGALAVVPPPQVLPTSVPAEHHSRGNAARGTHQTRARPSATGGIVTPDAILPALTIPAGSGPSAASSGNGGGGTAAAVLALVGVCCLGALAHARLPVDQFPWRSALLTSRLERPG
jgi:hypothetical protein